MKFKFTRKANRNKKGFTLIELMMSILIITIASAGALEAINMSNVLSIQAKETTIALADVRAVLDKIKITNLSNLPENATVNADTIWSDLNTFTSNGLSSENIMITGGSGTDLRQITVTISWVGPRNRNKTLQFSTMKSHFNG